MSGNLILAALPPVPAKVERLSKAEGVDQVRDAAEQFESLLIAQMLRSARESGGGWLGTGEDQAGGCALEMAEPHVAQMLSRAGGLGLASLVAEGLDRER